MGLYITNGTKNANIPKWDILGMSLLGGFYIHPFFQYGGDPVELLPLNASCIIETRKKILNFYFMGIFGRF